MRTITGLALVLFLAPSLAAAPVITRSTVKLPKKGGCTSTIKGTFLPEEWGDTVAIRFGDDYHEYAVTAFHFSAKKNRYTFREEKDGTILKAKFDLRKGRFTIKCRSDQQLASGESLRIQLSLADHWWFEIPVDPERKKTTFKGAIPPGPAPPPPLLGTLHSGWKSTSCTDCHELPVPTHVATSAPDCANCHGGNGACDPNGDWSVRPHLVTESCLDCHQSQHGFTQPEDCRSCHFALDGLDPLCGVEPPPWEETTDCFGWPETEFSPENYARPSLTVKAGQFAPDFTLADTDGVKHTLLIPQDERPVLLIFGALT